MAAKWPLRADQSYVPHASSRPAVIEWQSELSCYALFALETTELKVSTLITDPIPELVLRVIMPLAEGHRYPFANDAPNVAYGSIDRHRRMIFGSNATALRDPDFTAIARDDARDFSQSADAYQVAVGRPLGWRPLVVAERLCFTRDELPNGRDNRAEPPHLLCSRTRRSRPRDRDDAG